MWNNLSKEICDQLCCVNGITTISGRGKAQFEENRVNEEKIIK